MNKIWSSFVFVVLLFLITPVFAINDISIIPEPVKMTTGKGQYILPATFKIELNSNLPDIKFIATELAIK